VGQESRQKTKENGDAGNPVEASKQGDDTKNINIGGAGLLTGHRARKSGCGRKKKVVATARLRCRYWCFLLGNAKQNKDISMDTNEQTKNVELKGETQRPFTAFVTDAENYWIYLVNPTNTRYEKVVTLTGENITDDEGVLETGKSAKVRGALEPHSSILLENSSLWIWGEGSVWFFVDLYSNNNAIPEMLIFMPKKYYRNYSEVMLPVLNKMGRVNDLQPREKQIIIGEEVKTMHMKGAYHKFKDNVKTVYDE
jgi:hypothetical protein